MKLLLVTLQTGTTTTISPTPYTHTLTRTHMCASAVVLRGSSVPCPLHWLNSPFSLSGCYLGNYKQYVIIGFYKVMAPRCYQPLINETGFVTISLQPHIYLLSEPSLELTVGPSALSLRSRWENIWLVFVNAMCTCFLKTVQTNSYIPFLIANAVSMKAYPSL
jgi:hypothetical protein